MMVVEQDRKDALLSAMGDRFMREILMSAMLQAKSIEEIASEKGIPISTCYRRVHELVTLRLLRIEQTIVTDEGKKYETFRSVVKQATVTISPADISVDVTLQPREVAEVKLQSMWKSIRGDEMMVVSPVG